MRTTERLVLERRTEAAHVAQGINKCDDITLSHRNTWPASA